jgi:hypothetical protein
LIIDLPHERANMEQRFISGTIEHHRLTSVGDAWRRWGPYLSERAWGTVREDYSSDGNAWEYLSHDAARSRAYRWNEDGLAGISDDKGRMCFALALWNGHDPILKERLFGLTGPQGNHGEDVKEVYFYLDSTPTHSYMRMLYRYPQAAFPYQQLIEENARRSRQDTEYELLDTGVFDGNRYIDVFVEYAKAAPEDILIRMRAVNRGTEPAVLYLLPTIWFRNTWSWGRDDRPPLLRQGGRDADDGRDKSGPYGGRDKSGLYRLIEAQHPILGDYCLYCEVTMPSDDVLFTNNDTNMQRLFGVPNTTPYVKDAFHEYLVHGKHQVVNPARMGTKACALYTRTIAAGATFTLRLRLIKVTSLSDDLTALAATPFADFEATFKMRQREADEYYTALQPTHLDEDQRRVHRQALAGMLWSKQFYHYIVEQWLQGDQAQPAPPQQRKHGRNHEWRHLYNERVMSMPDKWEYPWYASWDLAFHCIPFALIDSGFAKSQLELLMREWYMHPNGQLPAYEWAFGDVNPPVFAWAAWRVYKIDQEQTGYADRMFLERIFHKLLLNFTWWVNRKDSEGKNVFQGGFLGLDNIGVFDRSAPLPTGGYIEQSDGTSWMGMFCLNMMTIALELAITNPVYEDIALKFFEHFLAIAAAMNNIADEGIRLWDEEDEFFYDVLHLPDDSYRPIKIRSLVGLIPLCAVEMLESHVLDVLPTFKYNLTWFLNYRPDLMRLVSHWQQPEAGERRLLALVRGHRMKRLLKRMLDPAEFLSDYGIRSMSKYHAKHPYVLPVNGVTYSVQYDPAESGIELFGGNSNWRGPVWFPLNYLLIESLQKFYYYYGDDFKVECPTGSGQYLNLKEVADELSQRLIRLFLRGQTGCRPFNGCNESLQRDAHWRDYLLFHEFFHGDNGTGLGASHQTGWTGLVAMLLQQQGVHSEEDPRGISSVGHRQTVPLGFEPLERS